MEQGSLPERYLTRSVIKHIRKKNPNLEVSAAVGNDYARMEGIISADGMGDTPWIAWVKSENNFACSGGTIAGARLTLLLPKDVKESKIKQYMADFNAFAEEENIQILGGHTQVSDIFLRPQFLVTMIGCAGRYRACKKAIQPGFEIVMVGQTGCMGANLLLQRKQEELQKHFSKLYLTGVGVDTHTYSIAKVAKCIADADLDVCYLHDASAGGIYGALWQLGVWMDKGFEISHAELPIRQETIEICEYFNINPYLLDATGCLLMVAKDGTSVVSFLQKMGIDASVIGVVTQKKDKMIQVNELEHRCLSPVNGDELHKVLDA